MKGIFWTAAAIVTAVLALAPQHAATDETYRLVHAVGNAEHEVARNLSKNECEERKRELKAIATALGTYNEKTGLGSIACLPESLL